jgi:hypothetical protein
LEPRAFGERGRPDLVEARSSLVRKIGEDNANVHAQEWGIAGLHDYVRPAVEAPAAVDLSYAVLSW